MDLNVLNELKKINIGETTDIIKRNSGYLILKLEDIQEEKLKFDFALTTKKGTINQNNISEIYKLRRFDANDFKLYNNKVLPSVQPTHATSDMYWADERLGERIYGAYAFKDLLNSSKKIALGTDFPVEKVNPFHTFYSSIERKDLSGYPENGFQKENRLNREETLKGMTIWGAYFNFEENEKGSLEIGKAADFIIINQDIMEIDAKLIPETKVIKTFVDGEMVYNLDN